MCEDCFNERCFCWIFNNVLLAVIVHLAVEEVGKTWLDTLQYMSPSKMIKGKDHTDSNILAAHRLPLICQCLLGGWGDCDKMSPSQWPCQSLRTLRTRLEQIGPSVTIKIMCICVQNVYSTDLGCNIGYRSDGDRIHAVESSISRPCGFRFSVNRAQRHEHMLVSLVESNSVQGLNEKWMPTDISKQLLRSPHQDDWIVSSPTNTEN